MATWTIPGLTMDKGSSLPANSTISFGKGTPIKTVPQSSGSVLGSNTTRSTGGGNTDPHINPSTGNWDDGYFASHNNGGNDLSSQISDAYAPTLKVLDDLTAGTNQGYTDDQANLDSQTKSQLTNTDTEGTNLYNQNDTDQTAFNKTITSALQDALRAYNGLQQQKSARFGGGSSAGQAVGELANQEYLRQQGQVNDQSITGTAKFADQKAKIGQYITQKKDQITQYATQATSQLKANLRQTLADIGMRKGDIEANKTKDKIAALQTARDQLTAIQTADKQFRQQLGLAAVSQMQQVAGRTFTPQEIKATIAEFMSDNVGGGSAPQGTTTPIGRSWTGYDDLNQLNPLS